MRWPILTQIVKFLKTFCFHLPQLNGTAYILVLDNLRDHRFLKLIFLGSYQHLQTLLYGHHPTGICLVIWLRFGLSHLREHKFKHSFQDT